jgi:hypothetical protein
MQRLNVCSFYVLRPNENPRNTDYLPMLRLLQKSCDALGLRHVVLSDVETAAIQLPEFETFTAHLPASLMRSCTEVQAQWIERGDWRGADTIMIGADCLVLSHPDGLFPREGLADMCVTLRPGHARYPINTGAIMVRAAGRERAAKLFRQVADATGTKWCDDQIALQDALAPMPTRYGRFVRAGLGVSFVPMQFHNHSPRGVDDPCRGACVLHFRGKGRKYMPEWAARNRPEWTR